MWWALAVSLAAEPPSHGVEVGVDLGARAGDPFQRAPSAGLRLGWRVDRLLALEARVAHAPNFGEGNWTAITRQLVTENRVSPDPSRVAVDVVALAVFAPGSGELVVGRRELPFDLLVTAGAGVVQTEDAVHYSIMTGEPLIRVQWHPTLAFGLGARLDLSDHVSLRLDALTERFVEVARWTTLELKRPTLLTVGVSFRPGRARPR